MGNATSDKGYPDPSTTAPPVAHFGAGVTADPRPDLDALDEHMRGPEETLPLFSRDTMRYLIERAREADRLEQACFRLEAEMEGELRRIGEHVIENERLTRQLEEAKAALTHIVALENTSLTSVMVATARDALAALDRKDT